jgi:hypothetical protein
MNKKAFRIVMALAVILGAAASLAAGPQAILTSLKGKVEVKGAGATAWAPATEGMVLPTMATVSTGFDSSVTIVIDKTTIAVKPLTRMTIDKLVEDQGKVTTSCYLRVGNAKASVKSAEGVKQDFKVGSPYSTASVRGTVFEYNGFDLKVDEGTVSFIPGRAERDLDLPAGAPAPDLSADFTGAPDTPANPSAAQSVGAGTNAALQTGAGGATRIQDSNDQVNLVSASTVYTSLSNQLGHTNPESPANTAGNNAVTGSIVLSWTRE